MTASNFSINPASASVCKGPGCQQDHSKTAIAPEEELSPEDQAKLAQLIEQIKAEAAKMPQDSFTRSKA